MVKVKICGITAIDDALAAARFGADLVGFIFAPSPRRVTPDQARSIIQCLPPFVLSVGLFVDAPVQWVQEVRSVCGLDVVQLHGSESEEDVGQVGGRVIKGVKMGPDRPVDFGAYPDATLLLDTYSPHVAGGTGKTFDWDAAVEIAQQRPIMLAGGLTPENVTRAVATVLPYGVDVASGVESEPGRKDHEKLERFIRRAKAIERPA